MNGKILALLLIIVALTGTAAAAQACGGNTFNTSAEEVSAAENNPILPPVAGQTSHDHHGGVASASGPLGSLGETRGAALNLAASSVLSWAHKLRTVFNPRIVEESCLASAVYFEARSESQQGQLAVAMVILNRVKALHYPSTICGVVYQGASHLNACQFSFACDGEPDLPEQGRAWDAALAVAALALADGEAMADEQMRIVATATNYHADYVNPSWSKSLRRLTKIGRHIFYSQG